MDIRTLHAARSSMLLAELRHQPRPNNASSTSKLSAAMQDWLSRSETDEPYHGFSHIRGDSESGGENRECRIVSGQSIDRGRGREQIGDS